MPCNAHHGEVDAAADRLRAAGCAVAVVSQARPEVLARYLASQPRGVPVVCDPGRDTYRAFGLERTGWATFFRPGVLLRYVGHMLRGVKVRAPYSGEDVRQLGGDFVLAPDGRVVYHFQSADPTRRPAVDELVRAVAAPAGPAGRA